MVAYGKIQKRDCNICRKDAAIAKSWGCHGPTSKWPFELKDDHGNVELVRDCPNRLLRHTDVWEVFRYYRFYKQGLLPRAGGIVDQPKKLMAAFEFIDVERVPLDEEERAHQQKEAELLAQKRAAVDSQ